jgi:hypothetical protein
MLFHTTKSLASPANGQIFHPPACQTLAHSLSFSSLSLRWQFVCLRLLLLVAALTVVVIAADRSRRGAGDDDERFAPPGGVVARGRRVDGMQMRMMAVAMVVNIVGVALVVVGWF